VRWVLLLGLSLAACGGEPSAEDRAAAEEAAAAFGESLRQAVEPATPAEITLEETEVADMGVSLRIPAGARTLAASAASTTYSLPLGALHEINVQVRGFGEGSLERAQANATMMGGTVAEANELEGGRFEVVLAPQGQLQKVYVFSPERSVQCQGPSDRLELLAEICRSMQAS